VESKTKGANMISWTTQVLPGLLVGCYALYQGYIRLPQQLLYGSEPPNLPMFEQESVFLIFSGFGGVDYNTDHLQNEVISSDKSFDEIRFVHTYDWSRWKGNTLRAAFDSERVGQRAGKELGAKAIKHLHVVGISVGAFAASACVDEYIKVAEKASGVVASTRLTLLDAFTARGVFGQDYGAKFFGRRCDYCEHFVNTDDPVPFTNKPLPYAHNFDITRSASRTAFTPLPGDNMHSWPVAYYGLSWRNSIDPRLKQLRFRPCHDANPRGALQSIP
jgi:hypothetical protein